MSTVEQKTTERDALITEVDALIERDDFDPAAARVRRASATASRN